MAGRDSDSDRSRNPHRPEAAGSDARCQALVGSSPAVSRVREQVARLARANVTVLITGETGTGKELVASALHHASARGAKRFLCVNCAALPDTLLESELFGYERGAFTGAYEAKPGLLRGCNGGTLFLDEVGDLSLLAQAKLLRAIESREVQRLGDTRSWPTDFRVVAATNREFEPMIEQGLFRKDLYYRLNVARIHMPPLRERIEDLNELVPHYVHLLNAEFGVRIEGVEPDAMQRLLQHHWPGNVRELRNLMEAAYVACSGTLIRTADLPDCLQRGDCRWEASPVNERERLLSALVSVNWNKSKAAERLKWSRMTVYRKMAKHGLKSPDRTLPRAASA